jgi:hypothetical protein
MNADQRPNSVHPEVVTTGPRAKQGDRRTWTFWVLIISTIAAIVVGLFLLSSRESFTAKPPTAAPASQSTKTPPAAPSGSQ